MDTDAEAGTERMNNGELENEGNEKIQGGTVCTSEKDSRPLCERLL